MDKDEKTTLKALCLEDSPQDAEIIHEILLDAGYDLLSDLTADKDEFVSLLRNKKYDIVLSDFKLPGFDAFAALELVKSICPEVPFVCVSGSIGEEIAIDLLKRGAVDYVLKDRMGRLSYAIQRALEETKEKESLRLAELQREFAQKALSESEHRYHTLAETSPVGIFHTRADGYTTYVNPKWSEISGLPAERAIGFGWLEAVHPDDRENVKLGWEKSTKSTQTSLAEYRFLHPDGSIRWVWGQAVPELDSENKIIGYVGTITDITERKLAEELLKESELKLIEAQRIGKIGNWEWYPSEDKLIWSDEMYNIFGIKPGTALTSKKVTQLFHPNDREKVNEFTRKRIEEQIPQQIESRIIRPDGEIRWVHGRGEFIINKDGQILKMIGIYQDITERKKAEEDVKKSKDALITSEERLRLALDATSDGLWDYNILDDCFYLSPRFYTMLGYQQDEFQPSVANYKRLVHPDDVEKTFSSINFNSKNEKSNFDAEYRLRSKSREWRWIASRFKIVKETPEGNPERIIGTITDITESKLSEVELKRINRALKVLSRCNEILIKAREEKILIQNICDKIIEIGGYSLVWVGFAMNDYAKTINPIAWAGKEDGYLKTLNLTWAENERGKGPTGTAIRTGKVSLVRDIRTDQNFIPWLGESLKRGFLSMIALPLKNNDISFGSLQILSSEVNAFDNNEIELLTELSNDLSYGILSLRTRENHLRLENQLLQSQKMEAIGRLAAGIAHDFNNILTVIMGNSDIVLSGLDKNDRNRILLEQIKSSSQKAASLTHQLLSFSRKQIIQPKILDLNSIVVDAQKMLTRLIGENIELIINCEKNLMKINADQTQIDQIIMNLVVNAKDAMPSGGSITIQTKNVDINHSEFLDNPDARPGKFVCLEITDTGIGMSKEILQNIFEPFFTTKTIGKGTGLGLSVVYGIVQQNNGWIEVDTQEGCGTKFKIFLPGLETPAKSNSTGEKKKPIYQGNGEWILVVEDDSDIREMIYLNLTKAGYEVRQAKNVKEALQVFNKFNGKFDLLFIDIFLPDGSGIELFDKLTSIKKDLKSLFTSGYADERVKYSIIQEKNYDFIQKPYEIIDLLKQIREMLSS